MEKLTKQVSKAVKELIKVKNENGELVDKEITVYKSFTVELSEEEALKLREEWARNDGDSKIKYKEQRQLAYPEVTEQLDIIYHQGIDAWKAKIAEIKAKYPKPN